MAADPNLKVNQLLEFYSGQGVALPDGLKADDITDNGSGIVNVAASQAVQGDLSCNQAVYATSGFAMASGDVVIDDDGMIANGSLVGVKLSIPFDAAYMPAATTADRGFVISELFDKSWTPVRAFSRVITPFAASGLTALTWTVGVGGATPDADALLLTGDSDGLTTGWYQRGAAHKGVDLDGTQDGVHSYVLGDAAVPHVHLSATGANLDTLTAGELEVYLWFSIVPTREYT